MFGVHGSDSWALEGRRLVPIPRRALPESILTGLANSAANRAYLYNEKLPKNLEEPIKRELSLYVV